MAGTEGKGFGGGYLSRWIMLGVFLLAVVGGAYVLLHDRLATPTDRLKQAELQAALAGSEFQVAVIPVEGMTCAACAARVRRTLEDIDGIVSAEVSLAERNVTVRYVDKTLSSDNLVAAINALGYRARAPIAAEPQTKATNETGAFASNASESQATSVTIPVTGMACEYCAKTLEESLRGIDGVTGVRISLAEKTARIAYDNDKVAVKRLTDEIDATGFKAGVPVKEGDK